MKILVVGSGKGSFQMRGEQLGAAIGARVRSEPTGADLQWCDIVILVKRFGSMWAPMCHKADKPIVWDALDFWVQPGNNALDEANARMLFHQHRQEIKPLVTIGATQAQAETCGGVYLPHHSWAGLEPIPPRRTVTTVAYQGGEVYLGRWARWLQEACQTRGWAFVVNPSTLADADLIVAFRDGIWDGWMCREWKSGVKLVNAIAAGRPVITQPSAAWREIQPFGSAVETRDELETAFDCWTSVSARDQAFQECQSMACQYTVAAVAERYRTLLNTQGAACLS